MRLHQFSTPAKYILGFLLALLFLMLVGAITQTAAAQPAHIIDLIEEPWVVVWQQGDDMILSYEPDGVAVGDTVWTTMETDSLGTNYRIWLAKSGGLVWVYNPMSPPNSFVLIPNELLSLNRRYPAFFLDEWIEGISWRITLDESVQPILGAISLRFPGHP